MSTEMNAENRNNRMTLPTRCCSFCRNPGHNILTCNNTRLIEFEQLCVTQKVNLGILEFKNWLLNYAITNSYIIKAYAVRYCGCTMHDSVVECVRCIIDKINTLNVNNDLRERNQSEPLIILNNFHNIRRPSLIEESLQDAIEEYRQHSNTRMRELLAVGSILFMSIMSAGRNELINERKFHIQTDIVECKHVNECECGICYDTKAKSEFVKLNCGHEFCKECIKQTLKNLKTENPHCAFCRAEINNMEITSQHIRDEFNDLLLN